MSADGTGRFDDLVDRIVEAPVVPSFTRIGSAIRSRTDDWTPIDDYDLGDRVIVLTGATSGLGLAAARTLAELDATVVLLGRDPDKTARVRDELAAETGNPHLHTVIADMGELDDVRAAAERILDEHPDVDTLVHNAGALTADRRTNRTGLEMTVASQVVGPFLLTSLLLDRLAAGGAGRVLTMSSGGMYTSPLRVGGLVMSPEEYGGSEQYARAKRAQVTLNESWPDHAPPTVHFHAMHPGWADTPGVRESLPTFRRVVGPLLRTPEQGVDTLLWLIADDTALRSTGDFWHDRRVRPIHKLGRTRRSDTPERRAELWEWVSGEAGTAAG